MANYEEFKNCKMVKDEKNPFCPLFIYEDGSSFYVEPIFYSYLQNFKVMVPDKIDELLSEMERIVRRDRKVIFTGMDEEYEEEPVTKADDYIILTIFDIADKLNIYLNNNSRGSDYGD